MMDIYVVANQKGGVGKTTLSVHHALREHKKGNNGLFIDMDGQCNGTKVIAANCNRTWFDAVQLFDEGFTPPPLDEAQGLTLIPATKALNEIERQPNETALRPMKIFQGLRESGQFDYCVIDTPPALCLRLIAALAVADFVVAPFELHSFSTDGIEDLLKTIMGVRESINPDMHFLGMLPNKFDGRLSRHRDNIKALYSQFGSVMIDQPVGNRDPFAHATETGKPIWTNPKSNARVAAKEMDAALDKILALATTTQEVANG